TSQRGSPRAGGGTGTWPVRVDWACPHPRAPRLRPAHAPQVRHTNGAEGTASAPAPPVRSADDSAAQDNVPTVSSAGNFVSPTPPDSRSFAHGPVRPQSPTGGCVLPRQPVELQPFQDRGMVPLPRSGFDRNTPL